MSSFDYCAKCGKLLDMYNPKHDCTGDPEEIDWEQKHKELLDRHEKMTNARACVGEALKQS